MNCFTVRFYRTENNVCPTEEFLNSLDLKMRAKMLRMIMLLETHGNNLREPYSKPLGNNIFELRAKQGNNISRALYFFMIDKQIIITNGFTKKSRKTPKSEIIKATHYMEDFLRRKGTKHE